jgi:diaminopimelate epimerase
MATRFFKYHGLGNDFLVIDARRGGRNVTAAESIALCHRHHGVGGDGVLWLGPPAREGVARLIITNSDGSHAEMCGNGIRCVAKYLADRAGVRGDTLAVETDAGLLACELYRAHDGSVESVRVAMGRPRLERAEIPMKGATARCVDEPLEVGGEPLRITAVSMGNPHAVSFDGLGLNEDAVERAKRVGPLLEHHPLFPARTNVELARVRSRREIDLVVWERGCGITQACGTGACATTVAAILNDRADAGEEVNVHLLGGTLHITVARDLSQVFMRGPATFVFEGESPLSLE